MKKLLLVSAISLLAFAGFAQAQEIELARYGVNDDASGEMQQMRQGQSEDGDDTMQRVQARAQVIEGAGEMIQSQIQERIKSMQERKEQLRQALKQKTQAAEKKQLLQQYRANEVSDFVKGINNKIQAHQGRMENISDNAMKYFEKVDQKLETLSEEKRAELLELKESVLRAHDLLEGRFVELANLRAELAELKAEEDWEEWQVKLDSYKALLLDIKEEMKAAIDEASDLKSEVE